MPNTRKAIFVYLILYATCASAMAVLLLAYPKAELHLLLNAYHRQWLDVVMRAYTTLAEWPIYILAALACLYRYSWTIYFALSELFSAALLQSLKFIVNAPRPLRFFSGDGSMVTGAQKEAFQTIVVDGVHLHEWHSFPSGHTGTFFVFFTIVYLLVVSLCRKETSGNKTHVMLALLCICLALLGGYSRVYLSQHFAADVLAGSAIGVFSAMLIWPVYKRIDMKPPFHKGVLRR